MFSTKTDSNAKIAYAQSLKTKTWYEFDDTTVTPVSISETQTCQTGYDSYLLFYVRSDCQSGTCTTSTASKVIKDDLKHSQDSPIITNDIDDEQFTSSANIDSHLESQIRASSLFENSRTGAIAYPIATDSHVQSSDNSNFLTKKKYSVRH